MPAQPRPVAVPRAYAEPGKPVLQAEDLSRIIDRIAHQILEKTRGGQDLVLLGIPTRGEPLAARLAARINAFADVEVGLGSLDITLYRDDLRSHAVRPLGRTVEPAGGIDGRLVVLVDDVLFSGRTVRAALDAINDLGRPRAVQLAVLIDRGHRELPIRADYVGKNLPTSVAQQVRVSLVETDGQDQVTIAGEPADLLDGPGERR
ncbi:MAG TPA: bifunctional pyr operon transcriptional regulator/uracil phosphoribosyltransferase PyrR [Jatrophihabitans sp.]|jgi:pyrimidine operon attenuation protein/uracil phosphoribosyltransferase|nr:bifunctional pyr operon transcriptional regulator/uracil phosphoribosyltransferase PyrR [Jatrophihabitans sp.]